MDNIGLDDMISDNDAFPWTESSKSIDLMMRSKARPHSKKKVHEKAIVVESQVRRSPRIKMSEVSKAPSAATKVVWAVMQLHQCSLIRLLERWALLYVIWTLNP